jgi:ribosomal protein S6--L-glutamate ligase
MRIGLILVRHPVERQSSITPEVARLLSQRGVEVDRLYPDEEAVDLGRLGVEHDLYVLKSGTETALSLAGALHEAGANILNPYPVAAACRDKVLATQLLRIAGVPLPETHVAARPEHFEPLLREGPLVLKPSRGSEGRGIRIVRTAGELADVETSGPLIAQRYKEPSGRDRKLYRIGDRVFGVKRAWPARTYEEKVGEPFQLNEELREIVWRCGTAFGIDLYGVDVVESDRSYVVDMSSFPGFKGVPDAAALLADYLYEAGRRALGAIAPPLYEETAPSPTQRSAR